MDWDGNVRMRLGERVEMQSLEEMVHRPLCRRRGNFGGQWLEKKGDRYYRMNVIFMNLDISNSSFIRRFHQYSTFRKSTPKFSQFPFQKLAKVPIIHAPFLVIQ